MTNVEAVSLHHSFQTITSALYAQRRKRRTCRKVISVGCLGNSFQHCKVCVTPTSKPYTRINGFLLFRKCSRLVKTLSNDKHAIMVPISILDILICRFCSGSNSTLPYMSGNRLCIWNTACSQNYSYFTETAQTLFSLLPKSVSFNKRLFIYFRSFSHP